MDKNNAINKYDYVKSRIKEDEDLKILPYTLKYTEKDSKGNKKLIIENFQTGGYGHKMKKGETHAHFTYTKEYWEGVFEKDFNEAYKGALKLLGDSNVNPTAVGIVTEMIYQIGYTGVSKFENTLKLVKDGRYQDAGTEMLDSKWARQTEVRATDLSNIMKSLEANIH